jgi:tRNA-splicing ligase RtcB
MDIPATARVGMRVPAVVFADEVLWGQITGDRTLDQLMNVATLPGVTDFVCAMPDAHEGYGFPVGGVAAFDADWGGVISPGGVGYDINCGVRLLASGLTLAEIGARLEPLVHDLSRAIPSGTGRGGELELSDGELDLVLGRGAAWLADRGWATRDDLEATEGQGSLPGANPAGVSARARARGRDQLGTIGSGNHFVEVQEVADILDAAAARAMGLAAGHCTVLIHTGSRGLGHQVCTDYVRTMDAAMVRAGITLPDRQLACAPFRSPEGAGYHGAMNAAANFAFANRQLITHRVRLAFARAFGPDGALPLVYDVAHNIAKLEEHGGRRLLVHRKGATRSFGPSHPETPARYRETGQPVLIPGSMGTASYVLAGTDAALAASFGSCCHGAGRVMSRGAAKRIRPGHEVRHELEARGIVVRCPRSQELAEEAPHAYKDVDRVVRVVAAAGLARPVARLVPRGVIKG